MIRIGTNHFVSISAAERYYRPYGLDRSQVNEMLSDGEIQLGEPWLKTGEQLEVIDNGTRYAIVED